MDRDQSRMPSTIAKGGGERRGNVAHPHWPADKNTEQRKYHFFGTSETVFCTGIDSKNDSKHILERLFREREANFVKNKTHKPEKKLKQISKN